MTLHLIPSEFPDILGNFVFFFISEWSNWAGPAGPVTNNLVKIDLVGWAGRV
jgi:hypothetical protein